jgi:fumarate reductase subunit C
MARKSYDQRLKERWLKQQQKSNMYVQREMCSFERMVRNMDLIKKLVLPTSSHPGKACISPAAQNRINGR